MKIHIIGGSGTGKTFAAEQISKACHIPHFDLDNIYWDNTAVSYGIKKPVEKRTTELTQILSNSDWVIEGVFYDWLSDSFSSADKILVLCSSPIVFNYRIIKRFIRRKLGLEKGKRETLRSLWDLILWTNKYQKNNIPKILDFLEPYKDKTILIHGTKELSEFICTVK